MSHRYRTRKMQFFPECIVIACHGLSIKSFVWIFFVFALISFLITYIHVMVLLEVNVNDIQFGANYDYLDVPAIRAEEPSFLLRKNHALQLGDAAREGRNMVASKMVEDPLSEIHGWWMPNVKWNAEIDCKTGMSHICRKVLSVSCVPDEIHSLYQFIPINPDVNIAALVFSATSSSPQVNEVYDRDSIIHSAIAYLKYTDSTYDHIRLDFSPGSHSEEIEVEEKVCDLMKSVPAPQIHLRLRPLHPAAACNGASIPDLNRSPFSTRVAWSTLKLLPTDKRLDSIMVILACQGFRGVVRFHETSVVPTANSATNAEAHSFSCAGGQSSAETNHTKEPIVERIAGVESSPQESHSEPTLGLVTQVNMDHIEHLHSMLSYWKHPISAAVFIPGEGQKETGDKQNWKKLYIEKKISRMKFPERSSVFAVYAQSFQEEYNQNALRNLALRYTSADYLLLLDAGLLPSPGFLEEFRRTVLQLGDSGRDPAKVAFIVPVFQMVKDLPVPNSKEELRQQVTGEDPGAVSYKRLTDPDTHRFTDYRRWFRTKDVYGVEVYQEKYEPFVIVKRTRSMPRFDERFPDGPLDRRSYTMELLAAGYELLVLPNVWAIAEASFQPPSSGMEADGFFHQTEVYIRRFEFVAGLMRTYRIGACKLEEEDEESEGDDR